MGPSFSPGWRRPLAAALAAAGALTLASTAPARPTAPLAQALPPRPRASAAAAAPAAPVASVAAPVVSVAAAAPPAASLPPAPPAPPGGAAPGYPYPYYPYPPGAYPYPVAAGSASPPVAYPYPYYYPYPYAPPTVVPPAAPRPAAPGPAGPPPDEIPDEGQPVPAGYRRVQRAQRTTVLLGTGFFGGFYVYSAGVALSSDSTSDRWLLVPIFGPLLDAHDRTKNCTAPCPRQELLSLDFALQTAGLALIFAGALGSKPVLERERAARWTLSPAAGPSLRGLQATGEF